MNSTETLQRPQIFTIGFCQQENMCKIKYLVLKYMEKSVQIFDY